MNRARFLNLLLPGLALLALVLAGCRAPDTRGQRSAEPLAPDTFYFHLMEYVYHWHFDEAMAMVEPDAGPVTLWVRRLHPDLDEGDESKFAEVWAPRIGLLVELKKAQYRIPEMDLDVSDQGFKVQTITWQREAPARKRAWQVLHFDRKSLQDHLFQSRQRALFPNDALRSRLREAVLEHMSDSLPEEDDQTQVFYTAPISPVCNDLWVFWENRDVLLQFSADMDLSHEDFWDHITLNLDVFELREDVVVTLDEVPGSNAYITKDWVGRVLYNCIVQGEKRVIPPEHVDAKAAER